MRVDRYIVTEWAKVFLIALAVTLGLLVLEDVYDDMPDLLDYGATPADILRYYLILTPSFLPTLLPVALMVSILFSLGNLHRNGEITALRAAGLSFLRITRGLWLIALLLGGLVFALNAEVVPWSVETSRTYRDNLAFNQAAANPEADEPGLLTNLAFYNTRDQRLWFLNTFSEYTFRARGVTLSEFDEQEREVQRIVANEAEYLDREGHWAFLSGRTYTLDPETNEAIRALPFDRLDRSDLRDEPSLMRFLEKRPKDLSLFELQAILERLEPDEHPTVTQYAVRYHGILAAPAIVLIVVGIAAPFAVHGVRINPFVNVSRSFGLFFLFYLLAGVTPLLATRGVMPPMAAAWVPSSLMLVVALYLVVRANR